MNISSIKEKAKQVYKYAGAYWTSVGVAFVSALFTSGSTSSGTRSASGNSSVQEMMDSISNGDVDLHVLGIIIAAAVAVFAVIIAVSFIFNTFVTNIFKIGAADYFTKLNDDFDTNRSRTADFKDLVSGYKNGLLKRNAMAMFMVSLYVFLWSLLFVIPGIIASYRFFLVPYILADNPDITWQQALAMSKEKMHGYKMTLFGLQFSFIGWYILTLFTCGLLGIFMVNPYVLSSYAGFYRTLCPRKDPVVPQEPVYGQPVQLEK